MKRRFLLLFHFIIFVSLLSAQSPFPCDGSFYLTLSAGFGNGQVHEVTIDNVTGNVTFNALPNGTGSTINATGYRITDNYIYGVHPTQEDLYRIGANGIATFLTNLGSIPSNHSYFSGDVSPSGDTLVLVGRGNGNTDRILVFIDLTDPTYPQTTLNLTMLSTGGTPNTRSADIAFDPITGVLYGFDGNNHKIVTYNTTTGVLDDVTYPTIPTVDVLGSLFFDPFGNLFGYGRSTGGASQTDMYAVDKTTGGAIFLTSGPSASGTDGCSCPYTIKFRKVATPDTISPCGRLVFDFEIVNTSGGVQTGIDFQDIMPADVVITQILNNPYGGTVTGVGTSSLNITGMTIPLGVDTLSVEVQATPNASGNYTNQAVIFNLPLALGGSTASDYPFTTFVDDPTPFTVVPTLQAFAVGDTTICPGAPASLSSAGLFGGGGPYTYSWSPTNTISSNPNIQNPTVQPFQTTTYTVSVSDVGGCTETADVEVEVAFLDIDIGPDTLICKNDSLVLDATFHPLDGVTYLWQDGSTNPIFVAHGEGTYWVVATDACGNVDSDTIEVTETLVEVSSMLSFTPTLCYGSNEGTATVVAGGGDPPYTYAWNDPMNQTTTTITNLFAGIYTVTITDSLTCRNISSIQVLEPDTLMPHPSFVDSALCFADPSGTAISQPTGGVGNYVYQWNTNPMQTTALATGLVGGDTYSVTVTDGNNCVTTDSVFIPAPLPLEVGAFSSGTLCFEQNDGTAYAGATGGTAPYTFTWDATTNSQIGDSAIGLFTGTYFVTVVDANGCTDAIDVFVPEAIPLDFAFEVNPVVCKDEATGSAEVDILNGAAPFVFTWDNGTIDSIATDLATGTYFVTVTDAMGCFQGDSVFVPEPLVYVDGNLDVTNISCHGLHDGNVEINPTGGTAPYQYSIDGGQTYFSSHTINGLYQGTYSFDIIDANGCTGTDTFDIIEPIPLELDVLEDAEIIFGDSVLVTALHNSVEEVSYIWTDQFNSGTILCDSCMSTFVKPTEDTRYFATVITEKGCEITDFVTITVVKPRNTYVPNAFSPNDDGTNDVFYIHSKEDLIVHDFKIYDRWGELVYQTTNQIANDSTWGWDGTFKGTKMNGGVFLWVADIEYADGIRETVRGEITLVR